MWPVNEVRGRAASDGIFAGPVVYLGNAEVRRIHSGSTASEAAALRLAMVSAAAEIGALKHRTRGEAADILAFQMAMLDDDALCQPALAEIARNATADVAWRNVLDAEIAGYENSENSHFRARAADLKDIRDRVLLRLSGAPRQAAPAKAVLVCDDLAPTVFLEADWSEGGAIVLRAGSPTSHVAMLARARGIPMVVGLGNGFENRYKEAIVDGGTGVVIFDPPQETRQTYAARSKSLKARSVADSGFLLVPARRKSGERVEILINVASVEELDHLDPGCCDGIGLMRSEFLFRDGLPLPDENQQYLAYRRFLEWADGKPVTIRTLDVGGDKPIRGLTPLYSSNPFLGLRGVRLTLAQPEIFRIQLRALARASVHGNLKVMIPMVTVPDELARSAALLDKCLEELRTEGIACSRPPLGIMVEVPAVAIAPELFAAAKFLSIGTNDLTQYVMAASRNEPSVAALCDSNHPAIMALLSSLATFGRSHNIPVSLCGDMASDPANLEKLLQCGLVSLSVNPSQLARIKAVLAEL